MITCEMFKGQTEVRPSDQRQAWALFSNLAFKTHQRPRLAPPGGGPKKKKVPIGRGAAALSVFKTCTFSYKISYNPAWQKEAINRGQNWLFNRSNRPFSGRL